MADRTTKVRLTAEISNYVAGMERAAKATRELTDGSAAKLAQTREALNQVGTAALAIGAVAAAGVAIAVKKFADFDEAMSNVKAATQETAGNMDLLRSAAIDAGGATVFSAVEAANAIEELGKAGLSTTEILSGGLSGALNLAAAGQLDVARAAEITAITIKQFNLQGKDATHVSDLLAAGAGKAAGDVEDLAQALNQSALVANQAGLSLEDTTGTLAAFASAGLLGSDAGTSLKTMLQRLTPQSKEAADQMAALGITAYDASGNFIGITKVAGLLQQQMKDLTPEARNAALSVMFGADAVRAASVLYTQGADGIAEWIEKTNDSGYAAKVAADRMDNLKGDVEKLGGAFDSLLINSGSGVNDLLRGLAQGATAVIDVVAEMPTPLLNTALGLAGVTAAALLVGGAFLAGIPKVAAFKVSLDTLGISMKATAISAAAMTGAIGLATLGIGYFIGKAAAVKAGADSFAQSLDKATGALTDYSRELVVKQLNESGAYEVAKKAGVSQQELTDAVLSGGKALDEISGKIDGLNTIGNSFSGLAFQAGNASDAIEDTRKQVVMGQEDFKNSAAATDGAAGSTERMAAEMEALAEQAQATEDAITAAKDAITNFGDTTLNANESQRAFQEAVDAATASLEENGKTLDVTTEAGRNNQSALDDLAQTAADAAVAAYELSGNEQQLKADLDAARDSLVDQAQKFGMTKTEAEAYADAVLATPKEVETLVKLNDTEAKAKLAALKRTIASMASFVITADVRSSNPFYANRENGGVEEYADGGIREGIYRGRPGGLIKFAEPTTGWEAFVSGKPGMENRNRGILMEAADRLGMLPALMPAQSAGGGDRPIYMDGSLFGVLRTVANGEAQIVLNTAVESYARDVRAGGLAA